MLEPQEINERKEKEIKLEGELINLSEDEEEELKLELEDNFDNYLEGEGGEVEEAIEEGEEKRKEENNNLNILECCSNLILNEQNEVKNKLKLI